MASCRNSPPEIPSITDEEAKKLLKQAFQKTPSYEAALMLKSIYYVQGDTEKEQLWKKACDDAEQRNIHSEKTIPNVFNES